jgi:hypothetical protein
MLRHKSLKIEDSTSNEGHSSREKNRTIGCVIDEQYLQQKLTTAAYFVLDRLFGSITRKHACIGGYRDGRDQRKILGKNRRS